MTMTVKLYDSDSYLDKFSAKVVSCEKCEDGKWQTVLDSTAFFPESGGQDGDTGTLDDSFVSHTAIEDGIVYHITDREFVPGTTVCGKINFAERFRKMQDHTGEHIVSGVIHKMFGFENVGFHLSSDYATADFNGKLDRDMLTRVEAEANNAVFTNAGVRAFYPDEDNIGKYDFRAKDGISGPVRLVVIDGYDVCACCAPHVSSCGQIGLIKILDFEAWKGGTRVFIKCGSDALADYNTKYSNVKEISTLLSAKQDETAIAVTELQKENTSLKHEIKRLRAELICEKCRDALPTDGVVLYRHDQADISELCVACDALIRDEIKLCAAYHESDGICTFTVFSRCDTLSSLGNTFRSSYGGKCGGKSGILQGKAQISSDSFIGILTDYAENL